MTVRHGREAQAEEALPRKAAEVVRAKAEFYADVECMPEAVVPFYDFTEKALSEVADAFEEMGT